MYRPLTSILLSCLFSLWAHAQDLPLLYQTDFRQAKALEDFEFSDPEAWRLATSNGQQVLELFQQSNYQARVRSPFNIAVLKSLQVGSFSMEVDLKQTGREYGHRDMCLFFGMRDPTNFYYVHIASAADEHAHNVFIVNDEPRRKIGTKTNSGIDWGDGWNKIRLEHHVESGLIRVFFNDMTEPIMEAKDTHFNGGYIGFGSFDDTGMVDNIKIWGEKLDASSSFFE